ncbi:MAG: hypothetical protein HWD86_06965 [Kangiellaceae bacterium]|nr:hypothetical protein [Kangiellaceae bacterium]
MRINYKSFIWILLFILVAALSFQQGRNGIHVESNILKQLPATESDPFAEKAFTQFTEKNMQQFILLVGSDKLEQATKAAHLAITALENNPSVSNIISQTTNDQQQAIGQLFYQHRHHLLSTKDFNLLTQHGADYFAQTALQLLYSPMSGQLAELMLNDPFLLSYRFINAHHFTRENQTLNDGFVTFQDGKQSFVLLSVQLNQSPFLPQTQLTINNSLQAIEKLWDDHSLTITLLKTGPIFYAEHAVNSAKKEISTIGLGSLIGVLLLLIICFVSLRPLILTSIALGFGIVTAFAFVHWLYGSIHLLTLVFGASLIGVAVDYAFHYFASSNEHYTPLPHIITAITLGLVSSLIGYFALYTAPFPGLRQIAVFCCIGLTAAYLTVVLLFDSLAKPINTPTKILALCKRLLTFGGILANRKMLFALIVIPIITICMIYQMGKGDDNIRQLQSVPPQLLAQEQQIAKMMNSPAPNQFFVVKGDSHQQLLDHLQYLSAQLDPLIDQKKIAGYTSIQQWIPSQSQQESAYKLIGRILMNSNFELFTQSGLLEQKDIDHIRQQYTAANHQYLSIDTWLSSPLGQQLSYLWLGIIDQQYASIVSLNHIQDLSALEHIALDNPSIYFVNKVSKISQLFKSYRLLAAKVLVVAIALIGLLLFIKYGLRKALLVVAAPCIAICIAAMTNLFFGEGFNLFNTLALFLILGIGIDYGLFYAEAKKPSPSIVLAVTLSAFTTLFSFGLLSLSSTPALHSFGLTMLAGIISVFMLSPIIGQLIHKQETV